MIPISSRSAGVYRQGGFTLIELLISLAIMAVLASIVVPVSQVYSERRKEHELQTALAEIRMGIDKYKRAYDEGRILHIQGASGYPPTLDVLVSGVIDAHDPKQSKIYFIRRIPRDPFAPDNGSPSSDTWNKRAYINPPGNSEPGADVYDVSSRSPQLGLNKMPVSLW